MAARHAGVQVVLFALVLVLPFPKALAMEPASTLCVVRTGTPAGLEPPALDGALVLEQKKWGITFRRVDAATPDACAPPDAAAASVALVLGPGEGVLVRGADGTRRPLDMSATEVRLRAQDVARTVMREFPRTGRPPFPPLVERELPPFPRPRPTSPTTVNRYRPGAYAQAGGWYAYQPGPGLHVAGPELEGGLTWLEERIALGVRVGWQPSRPLAGAPVPTGVQAVPVSVAFHAGVRFASVRVRAGLEVGVEWRRVAAGPAGQPERVGTGTVPILGGEIDVLVPIGRWVRLGGGLLLRGYLGGTSWDWHGQTAYVAPRFGVGCALRVGVMLPIGKGG